MAPLSKTCTVCLKEKSLGCFSKEKSSKDGLQFRCKSCRSDYYKLHKQHDNQRNNKWYWKNKVRRNEKAKEHYRNNKPMYNAKTQKRSECVERATIIKSLLVEELLCLIHKSKPKGLEIDHIIPLHNPDVCGLHVPWNLQYLPAKVNRQKGTRFELGNPKKYDFTVLAINIAVKRLIEEYFSILNS